MFLELCDGCGWMCRIVTAALATLGLQALWKPQAMLFRATCLSGQAGCGQADRWDIQIRTAKDVDPSCIPVAVKDNRWSKDASWADAPSGETRSWTTTGM